MDKLASIQLVAYHFDGSGTKEKLVYFLKDGRTLNLNDVDTFKKLERASVCYILIQWKQSSCIEMESTSNEDNCSHKKVDKMRGNKVKSNESYKTKYVLEDGGEREMILNFVYLNTTLGVTHLSFNLEGERMSCIYLDESMSILLIYNLKAAIFQTNEELKNIKERMKKILIATEKKLLEDFLATEFRFRKID